MAVNNSSWAGPRLYRVPGMVPTLQPLEQHFSEQQVTAREWTSLPHLCNCNISAAHPPYSLDWLIKTGSERIQ